MGSSKMTNSQQAALAWLPKDGSWRDKPGRMTQALNSLSRVHSGVLETKYSEKPIDGWGIGFRWRLTEAGLKFFYPDTCA